MTDSYNTSVPSPFYRAAFLFMCWLLSASLAFMGAWQCINVSIAQTGKSDWFMSVFLFLIMQGIAAAIMYATARDHVWPNAEGGGLDLTMKYTIPLAIGFGGLFAMAF